MIVRTGFNGDRLNLSEARSRATVTDHALIRYLQRVQNVDIDAVRARILTDAVLQAMIMDATSVRGDGYKLLIENFTVISTLPVEAVAWPTKTRGAR